MEDYGLQNHLLVKLRKTILKLVHLKQRIHFLSVCKKYDISPNGLKIKQTPNIYPASNSFINEWRNVIKDTERQLITKVLEENRKDLTAQLNNSENNIAVHLKENDDMAVIQKMLSEFIRLEGKLFNRRFTKFKKIRRDVDSRELRQGMKIHFEFSNCLKNKLLPKKLDCGHITIRKGRRKKIKKTPFEGAVQRNNTQNFDNERIDTSQNNILEGSANQDGTENEHELTDLAEILANVIKDNIPPALNASEQNLCLHGETSNTNNTYEINKEGNRTKGKLVSANIFNLSRPSITDAALSLLSKGLSFVPTPEKIDHWQVKNDLEKFGRNIRLKMHFLNEHTSSLSEVPAFNTPSK